MVGWLPASEFFLQDTYIPLCLFIAANMLFPGEVSSLGFMLSSPLQNRIMLCLSFMKPTTGQSHRMLTS